MLVMASLKEEMVQRPRYWLRLLEVLTVTAQREDTPSQIVQVSEVDSRSNFRILLR